MSGHDNPAEIMDDRTEMTAARRTAPAQGFSLLDIYEAQIISMHGIPLDAAAQGRVGSLWTIDERYGHGTYWYYFIDDIMALAVFSLQFLEDVHFTCDTPDLFCLGSYGRNMVPYFGITKDPSDRTLLGYAWKGQPYNQVAKANEPLDVTSILFLPKGLQRLSLACRCDPLVLSRAITLLDGTQDVPGLNTVLDEIRRARPSSVTAHAYYEAKITEAVALLLDWALASGRPARHPVRLVDHNALNLARKHLRDHLGESVTTTELCHIACMSPSKLTRLFKQGEGMTPQEYARHLRMEQACKLLEESDLSMAAVAEALGFARQGSFSEAFKDRFGVSPHEFRVSRHGGRTPVRPS